MPAAVTKCLASLLSMVMLASFPVTFAHAQSAPSADTPKSALLQALASAKTEQEGRLAEDALWQFWFNQSPTPDVRASLDAAIERREAYDFEAAENHLNKVVESAPAYAEGYNQRAFVRFLRENDTAAELDLKQALELEPSHFGAMSGLYHVLARQNRIQESLDMLRLAVELHPWLKERSGLPEAMWPDAYRELHESGQEI